MKSDQIREWDLIEWIRRQDQHFPSSITQAIGDDSAVFNPCSKPIAVTTDMLMEDVHFRSRWMSPYFLGRKSLAVNLSDLAAMGAEPYACLLALALPDDHRQDYFRNFVRGFLEESARSAAPLIGGDLLQSEKICVSVTAWGTFDTGDSALLRSSGQDGDAVLLIGEVGLARLGLEFLETEDPSETGQLGSEDELAKWAGDRFRYRCVRAHVLPRALVSVGTWLRSTGLVNAMIDVSDGLASDLFHIARASGLAAQIDVDRLPLPERGVGEVDPLEAALNGGEDHALLATVPCRDLPELQKTYPEDLPAYHTIGYLRGGEPVLYLKRQEALEKYEPKGFDHFR